MNAVGGWLTHRCDYPDLGYALTPTPSALLVVLLTSQERFVEARELLPKLSDWVRADDFAAWVDFRAERLARTAPSPDPIGFKASGWQ